MFRNFIQAVIIGGLSLAFCACEEEKPQTLPISEAEFKEKLIEANLNRVRNEKLNIDSIVEANGWNMETTGTGLRYEIYERGAGDSIRVNNTVEVKYVIQFLGGDTIYSSDKKGSESFLVGMDHIETGIHEAVLYMKVGDKSRVILPAHLAHGFMGDDQSIPPHATLMYDLHIISVQ